MGKRGSGVSGSGDADAVNTPAECTTEPFKDISEFTVTRLFLNRPEPPRLDDLLRIPDSLRAHASVAHLAGVCAATRKRNVNGEEPSQGPRAVSSESFADWIGVHLDRDAKLPAEVSPTFDLVPDPSARSTEAAASLLAVALLSAGVVSRASVSTRAHPRFSVTAACAPDGPCSRSSLADAKDARSCALDIVTALSRGVDEHNVRETSVLHGIALGIVRGDEELTATIAEAAAAERAGKDPEMDSDASDFVEAWLTPSATRQIANVELWRRQGVSPSRRALAYLRLSEIAPAQVRSRRRALLRTRAWIDENWKHNVRELRTHAGDDDACAHPIRGAATRVDARGNVSGTDDRDRIVAFYLAPAIERALLSVVVKSPLFGRVQLSCTRNMNTWIRRQDANAIAYRESFVADAERFLGMRDTSALLQAAIAGHATKRRRAAVGFGEPMCALDADGVSVATGFLREADVGDLLEASKADASVAIVLTVGLLLTAFANVIPWASSTRANPAYAVYREASSACGQPGGWAPATHREIADAYVAAAAAALNGLRTTNRASADWRRAFGGSAFTEAVGRAPTYATNAIVVALSTRRLLATNNGDKVDKLQELDPTRPLPSLEAEDLLALGARRFGCDGSGQDSGSATSWDRPSVVPTDNETTELEPAHDEDERNECHESRGSRVHLHPSANLLAWNDATHMIPFDSIEPRDGESTAHVLRVPTDPPLSVTSAHLRVIMGAELAGGGYGVIVRPFGAAGREWSVPVGRESSSTREPDESAVLSRDLAYVLEVHELLAIPWPGADTIAAFRADAIGPAGEQWDSIVIASLGFKHMEAPHARAQIARLCSHMSPTPYRPARRDTLRLSTIPPFLRAPVIEGGESDEVTDEEAESIRTMLHSALNETHGPEYPEPSDDTKDARRVVGHAYVPDDVVGEARYRYTMSDGGTLSLPASGWGESADDSATKSEIRRYWRTVEVRSVDEFLRDPQPRFGRITPHDAAKRLVKPGSYVAAWNASARRIRFTEVTVSSAQALLAWDRRAHLVQERDECFVYAIPNTVAPEYPLVVVAGLCVTPFLPLSIHRLIASLWERRRETFPHFRSEDVHFDAGPASTLHGESADRFERWMRTMAA